MKTTAWEPELDSERDDTLVYLSAARRLFGVGTEAQTLAACGQGAAQAVLAELAAEECAVCLREPRGELTLIGFATAAERFGGPAGETTAAGLLALAQLAGDGATPRCFARAADGGFSATGFEQLDGEGAVVLPFGSSDAPAGVLLLHWLVTPPIRFGRVAALRGIAEGVAQAVSIARDRESRSRLVTALQAELGDVRRQVSAQVDDIQESTVRLESLTQELLRANRVKAEFLANVSHELRTPLNVILGFATLLHDGMGGALSPDQAQMLDRVLGSTQHLRALIDDVLFFVHCECDRVRVQRDVVTAAELVDDVLAAIPDRPPLDVVDFTVTIAPETERLVIDPALARRILFHLLGNAWKFTSRGRIGLRIEPDGDADGIVITVTDTGVGIAGETLGKVFELFTQGDGSTTRRFEGLGLGLTLVQRSVQLLNGAVRVESVVDGGTTVRVTLPMTLSAPAAHASNGNGRGGLHHTQH